MADRPVALNDLKSIQVIGRFCIRMVILCLFAALGGNEFGRTLAALLMLSILFCLAAATLRSEKPFDSALTYWDEAAVYGLFYALIFTMRQVHAV
ncbi:MAG: hypothetical protein HXX15_12820 [Rhodopseudomonas sp.]|uniref:hypothetical protein n=1 Tax=Rhodopseudomonas sp. TaxID=1078 RepID=UPI001797BE3D|nr:hypothetical protein [Rhodopseudomonas sp.]NVN86956.1 hypothetical protein [Rhodopseudomonas sp.]